MNKKIKVLMIDNYDSFTYNLVHYIEELKASVEVVRNNKISVSYTHLTLPTNREV